MNSNQKNFKTVTIFSLIVISGIVFSLTSLPFFENILANTIILTPQNTTVSPTSDSMTMEETFFENVLPMTTQTITQVNTTVSSTMDSMTMEETFFENVLPMTTQTITQVNTTVSPSTTSMSTEEIAGIGIVSGLLQPPTIFSFNGTLGVLTPVNAVNTSPLPTPTQSNFTGTMEVFTPIIGMSNSTTLPPSNSTLIGKSYEINQIVLDANTTSFTFDPDDGFSELIITSEEIILLSITVPASVQDTTVNVEPIITVDQNDMKSVIFGQGFTVDAEINELNVTAQFPNGVKITGPSTWSGIINLPTLRDTNLVNINTGIVTAVIEMGFDDIELTFNKPVRLLFTDKATEDILFSREGIVTEITTICNGDDIDTITDQLGGSGECKTTSNNDRIIWTYHFTKFVTSEPIISCTPTNGEWVVSTSCILSEDFTSSSNVRIENKSLLIIPNGVTLDIDFANHNLTIKSGGGVLIKAGGKVT
jgi:hypothetical protein